MSSSVREAPGNLEDAVRHRYSAAAQACEGDLCCPIEYDPRYLRVIPQEVLERDYGCGDPSRYVREGDTVLDLGSGGGKICFIAAQLVGPRGRVIGVDMNDEMLALARSAAPAVAERVGYANVEFRRGRIQDLAPLVADASVDIVVSNCVLNLVRESDRTQLISEIFRVLKPGGRIAISDIVSDEPVPERLKADPELWSGCVSGAFHDQELLRQVEAVGFRGIRVEKREEKPFAVVEGIVFRSLTVTAVKGGGSCCG